MEFKGWITDFQQCSLQVIAMEEIKDFIDDLEEMIPESSHKYIDWEQTKSEQGHWPTKNTVGMWFKRDMNLVVMIDLLRIVKEELKKKHYTIKQREVVARLESSPQQKRFNRAHTVFFKVLNATKRDEKQIHVHCGKLQISFFVNQKICSKIHTPRGMFSA